MAEIRSVVLETGKMRDGKPKTDTGFEGQMRFKIACEDVEEIAAKTMGLAQILGIGRSRGIGLGEIKLKPHLPRHQKQTGN
jgi:CRISPR/Cas system endoribonuclease Cas6 (RAMP superfamily)